MNSLIVVITVVANTQTTRHIATHKVIGIVTQIRIRPLGHKTRIQSNGGAINDLVVIKGHVVQLIVGLISKRLGLDFHANRRRTRTRGIPLIVGHKPNTLIPVNKRIVSSIGGVRAVTISVHIWGHVRILTSSQITADRPFPNNLWNHIIRIGRRNRIDMVLDLTTIQFPMLVP